MHTEKEANKEWEFLGRLTPKGKQVAPNVAQHYNAELHTNKDGEMYPVVVLNENTQNIRGEYHPIGYRLNFPRYWGKKLGVTYLLKHNIAEKEKVLQLAQEELSKLKSCLDKVEREWQDNE